MLSSTATKRLASSVSVNFRVSNRFDTLLRFGSAPDSEYNPAYWSTRGGGCASCLREEVRYKEERASTVSFDASVLFRPNTHLKQLQIEFNHGAHLLPFRAFTPSSR